MALTWAYDQTQEEIRERIASRMGDRVSVQEGTFGDLFSRAVSYEVEVVNADVAVLNENMDKVEEALGKKPDTAELPAEVKKAVQDGTLTAADLGAVSAADKGKPNGVAGLGSDGKVPQEQLPKMDYAPASHATNKNNPHGVTAAQVGAPTTAAFNGHTGDGVKHVTAEERTKWNGKGAPYRHTFTLTAAGWAGTPAKQTVTVSGVTAALTPVADVVLTNTPEAEPQPEPAPPEPSPAEVNAQAIAELSIVQAEMQAQTDQALAELSMLVAEGGGNHAV